MRTYICWTCVAFSLGLASEAGCGPAPAQPKTPAAIPALIEALEGKDRTARYRAAKALGRIGPRAASAVPALGRAMRDKDTQVSNQASYALARIGPAAVPTLLAAAKDKDNDKVRLRAFRALAQVRPAPKQAVDVLIAAIDDWDLPRVKPVSKEADDVLIAAISDPERPIVDAAVYSLGNMGPDASRAVPAISRVLSNSDVPIPISLHIAAHALLKIPPKGPEAVVAALKHQNVGVRRIVGRTLLRFLASSDLEKLGGADVRVKVIHGLSQALTDRDPEVREHAAEALGHTGKHAIPAIPRLIAMLPDEGKWYPIKTPEHNRDGSLSWPPGSSVYFEAVVALIQIGDPAIKPLVTAFKGASTRAQDRIYMTLIGMVEQAPSPARENAVKALRRLSGQDFGNDVTKWHKWHVEAFQGT